MYITYAHYMLGSVLGLGMHYLGGEECDYYCFYGWVNGGLEVRVVCGFAQSYICFT